MVFEAKTKFVFDGSDLNLTKFNRYGISLQFKDRCLPIVLAHLKPMELIVASMINSFAPPEAWGLIDHIIMSEKEIDAALMPAFQVMLYFYYPTRNYTLEHLDNLIQDPSILYDMVYSQMVIEGTMDYYIRRKITFLRDLQTYTNLKIDLSGIKARAEDVIKSKLGSTEPDTEFTDVLSGINGNK